MPTTFAVSACCATVLPAFVSAQTDRWNMAITKPQAITKPIRSMPQPNRKTEPDLNPSLNGFRGECRRGQARAEAW